MKSDGSTRRSHGRLRNPREQEPTLDDGEPADALDDEPKVGLQPGQALGRYVILDHLGSGAMGAVYRAHDPDLDRTVAIKVLLQEPESRPTDRGREVRLLREARALARLSHPNVVPIYDVGLVDVEDPQGEIYMAMEFVRGRTLRRWLEHAGDWRERLRMLVDAGRGLAAAHQAELVHRDFKPDNVIIDDTGRARVMDFGLARGRKETSADSSQPIDSVDSLSATLTRTGAVVGTPAYMAPEQHVGKAVDERADQFAFCVVSFEAVFAERPFRAKDIHALARLKYRGEIAVFEQGEVPPEVTKAIVRGLAPNPDSRWPDMDSLLHALEPWLAQPRRKWPWVAGGAAAVASVLGLGLGLGPWWSGPTPCRRGPEQWAEVWNPDVARSLEGRYQEVSPGYGPRGFQAVREGLDAYGARWSDAYRQTCEAVQRSPSPALDLEMMCVQRRRLAVESLLEILSDPTPRVVLRSASLVAGLQPPTDCSDLEGSSPTTAEESARIEIAARWIDRARTYDDAGQPSAGLHAALAGHTVAYTTPNDAIRARADIELGLLLKSLGRYQDAEHYYDQGYQRAAAAGLDRIACDAATHLVFVVGALQERSDDGLAWARIAHALLERIEHPGNLRARVLENEANALTHDDRPEEALALLERALELRRKDSPSPGLATAMVYNNMGLALSDLARFDDALRAHHESLEIRERILGTEHPTTAMSYANLGGVQARRESYTEARPHIRKALDIWTEAYGAEHPRSITMLQTLGAIELRTGNYDTAETLLRRVADVRTRNPDQNPREIAVAYGNLAAALFEMERFEEGRSVLERGLAVMHGSQSARGPEWAWLYFNLGLASTELGELEEAERQYLQALELWGMNNPDHSDLSYPHTELGRLYLQTGRPRKALPHLQRSAVLRHSLEPSARGAVADFLLGRALWETGEDQALGWTLVQQAEQALAQAPARYERERGWVRDFQTAHADQARELGLP